MRERVQQARQMQQAGFSPVRLAGALGISRQAIYGVRHQALAAPVPGGRRQDEEPIQAALLTVCGDHPRYGTRRVRAVLGRRGWAVNRKRVQRLMRQAGLLVPAERPHPKSSGTPFTVTAPNQLWQTDLTKFWAGRQDGWAYVTAVIDCYTRELVGHAVTRRCRTADVLEALQEAVEWRFPEDDAVRRAALHVRRDHGSQFTSRRYVDTLAALGITGELSHYRHPDGNAFVERFFGTLKDEEIWCTDYSDFESAKEAIDRYILHYNAQRLHSSLGYRTPVEVWQDWTLKSDVA